MRTSTFERRTVAASKVSRFALATALAWLLTSAPVSAQELTDDLLRHPPADAFATATITAVVSGAALSPETRVDVLWMAPKARKGARPTTIIRSAQLLDVGDITSAPDDRTRRRVTIVVPKRELKKLELAQTISPRTLGVRPIDSQDDTPFVTMGLISDQTTQATSSERSDTIQRQTARNNSTGVTCVSTFDRKAGRTVRSCLRDGRFVREGTSRR